MKKYLFIICVSIACFICMIGCSSESNLAANNNSSESEENGI